MHFLETSFNLGKSFFFLAKDEKNGFLDIKNQHKEHSLFEKARFHDIPKAKLSLEFKRMGTDFLGSQRIQGHSRKSNRLISEINTVAKILNKFGKLNAKYIKILLLLSSKIYLRNAEMAQHKQNNKCIDHSNK